MKFIDKRGLDNVKGVRHNFALELTPQELKDLVLNLGDIIDFDIDIIYANPKYKEKDELEEMLNDDVSEYNDDIEYGMGR